MSVSGGNTGRWLLGLVLAGVWTLTVAAWLSHALPPQYYLEAIGLPDRYVTSQGVYGVVFIAAGVWAALAWLRSKKQEPLQRYLTRSLAFFPLWQVAVFAADEFDFPSVRATLADLGLAGAFFIGLGWLIWYVERQWSRHVRETKLPGYLSPEYIIWNPFHPQAWYYGGAGIDPSQVRVGSRLFRRLVWFVLLFSGRGNAKLTQSLMMLGTYSALFFALFMLAGQLGGCREIYEIPAGGGKQQTIAQTVKIQKVIKKKFVINPYSSIIFKPPPIDEVKLQLMEITAHQYAIGQGEGDGAGYAGGTSRGKVRFIRLEYSGGDWNQDMGVGLDLNMLIQYGVRTGQSVAEETETRTIAQLENFPAGKSPPLMYLTGQKKIELSKSEVKTLREYLLDKHGMLFIDNGGSQEFHRQAFGAMRQIAPEIEPVKVPLDDVIHRIPFQIPFLPYVAPHGGRDAYGWKLDGRWIAYYHPGDIGDAWSDGHSGVKTEVWEACYQLGTNVINYAHAEYSKWLTTKAKK